MTEQGHANAKDTFWENYWCEEDEADDLFPEEGNPTQDSERTQKVQEAQEDARNKGMLEVRNQDKCKDALKETLMKAINGAIDDLFFDEIFENIERAGKATCYVRRKHSSDERRKFHQDIISKYQAENDKNREIKKYHEKKLAKAEANKGAVGTGLLITESPQGWLVITNNHVIMNADEAQTAKVVFDYLDDQSDQGTRVFEVSKIVSKSLRTKHTDDHTTLDYSLLALKCDDSEKEFLDQHALRFEETARIQACSNPTILDRAGLKFLPLIAFSHPHGLAKRLSIGEYPMETYEYPIAHIKHNLPSAGGSSGANLLFSSVDDKRFVTWNAGFLHYRSKRAVAWQAIGPELRKHFSTSSRP